MGLRKCPKCEINYIRDDQQFCEVCSRKHRLSEHDEDESDIVLCAECGEHPAMKGKELCKYCYAERLRSERPLKKSVSEKRDFDDEEANEEEADDEASLNDDEIDDDEIDDDGIDDADMDEADGEYDDEKEDYAVEDDYSGSIYPDD